MVKQVINRIKNFSKKTIVDSEDEYLSWLSFANAGMLNKGNIHCFEYAIRNMPSKNPVIEIGSFCGLSTNVICYMLQKYKRQNLMITSDKWIFEGAEEGGLLENSNINHADYRDFVVNSFKRNINFFSASNLPYPVEVFSDEFFKLWEDKATVRDLFDREILLGGGISFAYIDGNHTYEFAKRDFENTSKFLDIGGFILFDDSSDYSTFGCSLLMKEIKKNTNYEVVMKNPNYLFRKIK